MSHTDSRSDLMALADTTTEPTEHTLQSALHDRSERTDAQEAYALAMTMRHDLDFEARLHSARNRILKLSVQLWEARKALAASQPDREAVARAIEALKPFAEFADVWRDIPGVVKTYPDVELWQKPGAVERSGLNVGHLRAAAEALSLLSGAGTKSDGGACGNSSQASQHHNGDLQPPPSDPSPRPDVSLSAPVGEPVAHRWRYRTSNIWNYGGGDPTTTTMCAPEYVIELFYTHPPAPTVDPDVREALTQEVDEIKKALYRLRDHDSFIDIFEGVDGPRIIARLDAILSALTRPLGGFVQGSIARKQSTDPEGSSRTETAGGDA